MEDKNSRLTSFLKLIKDNFRGPILDRIKICFLILLLYFILNLLQIGCPIKDFTGISCPGCGMTRAILAVLRFDFQGAFYFHPLYLITPFMLLLFLFDSFLSIRLKTISWSIIVVLFISTYLLRMLLSPSSIVSFDIPSGIIYRIIHAILTTSPIR